MVSRYQKRISGPLLDRIDIHIEVPRVEYEKLSDERLGEPSAAIRKRVEAARFERTRMLANANLCPCKGGAEGGAGPLPAGRRSSWTPGHGSEVLHGIPEIYPLALYIGPVPLYDRVTRNLLKLNSGREEESKMHAKDQPVNIVIQVDRLSATYGRGANVVEALRDVSLEIQAGEIFGLLGPNGAGKTTLLSCVEGLHKPARGTARVGGVDVSAEPTAAQHKLGIQLQHAALLDDLTVAELVQVYAALYEVYLSADQISSLLNRFGVSEKHNKLARRLSGGQRQRLALALAVASDPEIVLLDEPTSALDPHARRGVWGIIRELHSEGRTIVITTHAMEEAEALCGRVAIIDGGLVIACDTPARLVAALDKSPVLKTSLDVPLDQVQSLPGVHTTRYAGQYLEIETSQPQVTLAALQGLAHKLGRSLGDVMLRQPNLEDVFLKLTGKQLSA